MIFLLFPFCFYFIYWFLSFLLHFCLNSNFILILFSFCFSFLFFRFFIFRIFVLICSESCTRNNFRSPYFGPHRSKSKFNCSPNNRKRESNWRSFTTVFLHETVAKKPIDTIIKWKVTSCLCHRRLFLKTLNFELIPLHFAPSRVHKKGIE